MDSLTEKKEYKLISQGVKITTEMFANKYWKFILVALSGLTILIGIDLMPDSFAYMEGANNLLRGNGFAVNFNLESASAYQPFYSYLMIPFIYVLGYSTQALLLFHIILFISTFYIYDKLLSQAINELNPVIKFFCIIISIYPYFTVLLSESLLITFLGLYLNVLFFHCGKLFIKYFYLTVLLFAIFWTKNSALLIIIPLHLSLIEFKRVNRVSYYLKHSLFLAFICLVFLIIKIILRSTDSHSFVFGGGQYSFFTYLVQIYRDISVWIFGRSFMHMSSDIGFGFYLRVISISILIFAFISSSIKSRLRIFLFILYALAIHLFVFSNVSIGSLLNGRFLFWFYFVFLFTIIANFKNRFMKILFGLIIITNLANIAYSRFKTFQPDVVALKLKYSLDPRAFDTKEVRYPALIKDSEASKYIIISPAYPWFFE